MTHHISLLLVVQAVVLEVKVETQEGQELLARVMQEGKEVLHKYTVAVVAVVREQLVQRETPLETVV
jgi:hypothetical protein